MARRVATAPKRKKPTRPKRKNNNGPKTGQVAALRKEIAALRTGLRSVRLAGTNQQAHHRAKLAHFSRYARIIADPFSAPLVPAPAVTADVFGRNLQISSGLSLRRVFLTTITVPPGEEAQFAIPLTASTGHGAVRRCSRNISTGAWSTPTHFNTTADVEPFAVNSHVRLVAGQLKLTCLNRADELGGTVRFYPTANHHCTDTHASSGDTTPFIANAPGTVSFWGGGNVAQMVHAPVAYRNDARRHVLTVCPHLAWHNSDTMTEWIGATATTLPSPDHLWTNTNAVEGQPVGFFMVANPTAATLSFELECAAVIEVFNASVQSSMTQHPIVSDVEEHMDTLSANLSRPRGGLAHTIDVVEAGLSRASSVAKKGAEAVMSMLGLVKVSQAAWASAKGAARLAGPVVEEVGLLAL